MRRRQRRVGSGDSDDGHGRGTLLERLGDAEVGHACLHVGVEQDVAGLEAAPESSFQDRSIAARLASPPQLAALSPRVPPLAPPPQLNRFAPHVQPPQLAGVAPTRAACPSPGHACGLARRAHACT
jgi:hypothetical protein